MDNTTKILTAFAVGATAGIVLGILFAPAKGSETRNKIADAGNNLTDNLEKTLRKGKDKFEDLKNVMKEKAEAIGERLDKFA